MINTNRSIALSESNDKPSLPWDGYSSSIIENVNVWLNVYDKNLNILVWNPMAEIISGYTSEEVLGHNNIWEWLYPDEDYKKMIVTRATNKLLGTTTIQDWETQIVCKQGNLKTIAWSSETLYDEDSQFQGAITFGYDVTDRKQTEGALKNAHEELSVLYNVASVASGSLNLDIILKRSLAQVLPIMKSPKGIIHLWHEDSEELRLAAYEGVSKESVSAFMSLFDGDGLIRRVFRKEVPIFVPNVITELKDAPKNVPSRLFHAYLGVPMRAKGRACGVFSVLGKAEQIFSTDEITLLTSIADQIGVAVENARLYQQSRKLAISEERRRLARELHDSVTQSLYSLTLFAEAGQRDLHDGKLDDVSSHLTELGQTAHNALNEMRVLLHELRPLALETEGLLDAIQRRLDAVERKVGIKAYLIADHDLKLPSFVEQELYRIIQEALNNTLRHAFAKSVTVSIQITDNVLTVKIADEGVGFDSETATHKGGIGLESMQERAHCLGGELRITSVVGEGVTIFLNVILDDWEKE